MENQETNPQEEGLQFNNRIDLSKLKNAISQIKETIAQSYYRAR